jgi:hypothetical protein
MSPQKAKVVYEDANDNNIIVVDSSDKYDEYGDLGLGWWRLRDVTSATIDEFDIPESLAKKFKSGSSKTTRNFSDLNIHYGTRDDDEAYSVSPGDLEDELKDGITKYNIRNVVLFPRGDSRNVGDNKDWLPNTRLGVASCTGDQWEQVKDVDGVHRAKEYFRAAQNVTIKTTYGKVKAKDIDWDNTAIHVLSNSLIEYFKDDTVMSHAEDFLREYKSYKPYEGYNYVPMSYEEMDKIRPIIRKNGVTVIKGDYRYDIGRKLNLRTDVKLYANARLYRWANRDDCNMFSVINGVRSFRLDEGALEVIENLAQLHDAGKEPVVIET